MPERWNTVSRFVVFALLCGAHTTGPVGYRRTVLVLFPYNKELDILLESGGVSYALRRLKRGGTGQPDEDDQKVAKFIVDRIKKGDTVSTQAMTDYAVQWNDLAMWSQVVKSGGTDKAIDILGKERLVAAWMKFSFDVIQST